MKRNRSARFWGVLLGALVCLAALPAQAKPELPSWLELDLEYRVQSVYIHPLELSGVDTRNIWYTEQRMRIESGFKFFEYGGIFLQLDLLDGVLFGDNGQIGGSPEPSSGMAVTSRWPNNAGWDIGLRPGGDPFAPEGYGPVLVPIDPVRVTRVYADVNLPFGLLRVGRQPAVEGASLSLHDGSRTNRWGVSNYSYTADRVLFATKISEAVRLIAHGRDGFVPNRSMDDGVFLGFAYDIGVQDDIHLRSNNLHQITGLVMWKADKPQWFGLPWDFFHLQVAFAGRFGDEFATEVFGLPAKLEFSVGQLRFLGEFMALFGKTREASEGMAALREMDESRRQIYRQKILAFGARSLIDWDFGPVMATLELAYASGDDDPRDNTALTTFNFARDTNVGLLLFNHILAFESARSAAVGIENLAQAAARSFPVTELRSEGRVHNAMLLFPQVLVRPLESFHVRFGALFAWSAKPVVDPVMTLLNEDGIRIDDDAVNWHGGRPARYYGTELDLQLEWRYRNWFTWTVEAAVLFPGEALQDESGDAVPSFLVENRFLFTF